MPSEGRGPGSTPERPASQASEGESAQIGGKSSQPISVEPERAPEQSASQASEAEAKRPPPWRPWAAAFAVLAVLFLAVVGFVVYERFLPTATPQNAQGTLSERVLTESLFQDSIPEARGTSDGIEEWRATRSDHKIIAYAIARCLKIDVGAMSPDAFSMLLLDLRPNGDHLWRTGAGTARQPQPGDQQVNQIDGYQGAMLALSDAVSRARIAAASGAGGFYPQMWWFGWISVFISALATMIVTLRSSRLIPLSQVHQHLGLASGI